MKATAVALLVLSVYWVEQGIVAYKQQDAATAIELVVMGVVLLPIAKYLWSKDLGPKT